MTGDTLLIVLTTVVVLVGGVFVLAAVVGVTDSVRLRRLLGEYLPFLIVYLWLLPVGYVAVGVYYWLIHGSWMSINLCYDSEVLCGTGKALGVDKILQLLADSPFLVVLGVTAASCTALILLSKDIESEARLDRELEDFRKREDGG